MVCQVQGAWGTGTAPYRTALYRNVPYHAPPLHCCVAQPDGPLNFTLRKQAFHKETEDANDK